MGNLEQQVRVELDGWGLAETSIGASALDIARRLDDPNISPTAASLLHGQLRQYLRELRDLAPDEATDDAVDEVRAQREKRLKAAGLA